MELTLEKRHAIHLCSPKEQRELLNGYLCELCQAKPARRILEGSLIICCYDRATNCPSELNPTTKCFGCGKSAVRKSKAGFVCGNSYRGCQAYENSLRKQANKALQKHYQEDPKFALQAKERHQATCIRHFGVPNPRQAASVKAKAARTSLKRFGVSHHSRAPEIKEKVQKTLQTKYGVDFVGQLPQTRNAARRIYNVENVFQLIGVKLKSKATCLKKFGVKNVMCVPEIAAANRSTGRKTNLKRYGFKYAIQNPEVFRSVYLPGFYATHQLTLPSGRIVNYQGYEDRAILKLMKTFTEDELAFGGEMSFPWTDPEGDKHTYYPDLCIKSKQTAVEVKSEYTLAQSLADGTLFQKLIAVRSHGWLPVVQLWDSVGDEPMKILTLDDFSTL